MQGMISGPMLLTGAACSVYAFLRLKENFEFGKIRGDGEVLLSTSIKNLSLRASKEEREGASRRVYEFLKNSKKSMLYIFTQTHTLMIITQ